MLVGVAGAVALGCSKKKTEAAGEPEESSATVSSATVSSATVSSATVSPAAPAAPSDANEVEAGAKAEAAADALLRCDGQEGWEPYEMKHLQTGAVSRAKEGAPLPELEWQPCDGKERCERLVLTGRQKLLAVGANGNAIDLVVAETCGDDTMVTVGPVEGAATTAIRGEDMAFETAAAGGGRFLLGGFARHRTEQATEGFVPREYLLTGRKSAQTKLEPARNKQKATPAAAASQIVQVAIDGKRCTTLFWKLGVDQCDFEGPDTEEFVMFGAHLLFRSADGKGMTWNAKGGLREVLPSVDWFVSDGVNVLWSREGQLYMTQPRWDFEDLTADPLPGEAGPKPVAIGCDRSLAKGESGWVLRNLKAGTYWELDAERFPEEVGDQVAMNCDWAVWNNGYRVSLASPGTLQEVSSSTAPAQ